MKEQNQQTQQEPGSTPERNRGLWILLGVFVTMLLLTSLTSFFSGGRELPYSEFVEAVRAGQVESVTVGSSVIRGKLRAEEPEGQAEDFRTVRVSDEELVRELMEADVKVAGQVESTFGTTLLFWMLPLSLLLFFLFARMSAARQSGFMTVGKSKAKVYAEKDVSVRFTDVAGVDEAKDELREVIDFLKTPEKFRRLGGKIPKGILLVGPPGTGKTLLARAVAGEAGVAFFSISGSEFVEMFVGVGAARVRDLFNQARQRAPCIIFIDELDALGKVRGAGPMAHEEREQTLNQLLVELDGFDPRAGVILMAASNRPEILDPALLRAGRFDRHVLVDRPDKKGRLDILKVHARNIPLADPEALEVIAGLTAGMVGADMANIVNEAALLAVRRGKDQVERADLEEAVERVVAGLEKRNRVLNPMERERVAHHEVGHALVGMLLPGMDRVRKVSIIPRGVAALGYTIQAPTEDRFLMTQAELENRIAMLLGGRVAERLVYGDFSTGARDDLLKATDVARTMITAYGMSPALGHVSLQRENRAIFLPGSDDNPGVHSEEVSRKVDAEVQRILEEQYARVTELLEARVDSLRRAAAELLQREVLSGEELQEVLGPGDTKTAA